MSNIQGAVLVFVIVIGTIALGEVGNAIRRELKRIADALTPKDRP